MNRPQARDADGCSSRRTLRYVDRRFGVLPFDQLPNKTEDSFRRDGRHLAHCRVGRVPDRAGQTLVEFALVALVLYMLLAAILTFGHLLFVAQNLQTAADLAARELSRTPLRPDMTFKKALKHESVRRTIFDDAYLVIDLCEYFHENSECDGEPKRDLFPDIMREVDENLVPLLPLVNQQLLPSMIIDRPDLDGDGVPDAWLLRYPGALLTRSEQSTASEGVTYPAWVRAEFTVGIPVVRTDANGAETIRWLQVVEEVESPDPDSLTHNPFVLTAEPKSGVVALRINYPFQSAAMSSWQSNDANLPDGQVPYAGIVRPYRRVISTQAIYRREIFGDGDVEEN